MPKIKKFQDFLDEQPMNEILGLALMAAAAHKAEKNSKKPANAPKRQQEEEPEPLILPDKTPVMKAMAQKLKEQLVNNGWKVKGDISTKDKVQGQEGELGTWYFKARIEKATNNISKLDEMRQKLPSQLKLAVDDPRSGFQAVGVYVDFLNGVRDDKGELLNDFDLDIEVEYKWTGISRFVKRFFKPSDPKVVLRGGYR